MPPELIESSKTTISELLKALNDFLQIENGRFTQSLRAGFPEIESVPEQINSLSAYFEKNSNKGDKARVIETLLHTGHHVYNQLFRLYHFFMDYCTIPKLKEEPIWAEMADNSVELQQAFQNFDQMMQNWGINFHKFNFLKSMPANIEPEDQIGQAWIFSLGNNHPIFQSVFNDQTWYSSPSKTVFDASTVGYQTTNFQGTQWASKEQRSKVWMKLD
ncbi:MAG: hypothetical protein COT92_01435 [Candidatus Doudnabacteria bacterium CG10_big_fil_rev_8_21_14_0_10_42_18]|uniref:Uncharacterized protein n=1 Tax=Candidatus Doudnabacteria bacterium CG10_big_fil_rev_8_21_14_0_10_42_18 TaxID=1974552 RepID=A0A2H0VBA6_9BACT|nr:MAG: hypothetical protein COT92_01435 [Candidatus Doudnabacteria bacterium CG10_big_fil_rev_8_21_14_0_10_42_18]